MIENEGNKRRTNLGRGLSALLGEDEPITSNEGQPSGQQTIAIEFLKANPDQPRKRFDEAAIDGLVKSIEKQGILQPILVRKHPNLDGHYEIVAGERRWRAAQRAQLHEIPIIIKELNNKETLEIALIENIHREDLTALEEAEGYQTLMDEFSYTQEELSKSVGKSRSHIANMLRLLGLSDEIKSMIDDGLLSAGHGRALVSADMADELAHEIITKDLNVRQTERLVQDSKIKTEPDNKISAEITKSLSVDPNITSLENMLSDNLGLRVEIASKGEKGKMILHYNNFEQLDSVIASLSG